MSDKSSKIMPTKLHLRVPETPTPKSPVPQIICQSVPNSEDSGREEVSDTIGIAAEKSTSLLDPPDALLIHYNEDFERVDSEFQVLWSELMEKGEYRSSSSYKHVAVLLISWAQACNDLSTEEEVDKLARLFAETFNYNVSQAHIRSDSKKTAQAQVNARVANFVLEEDGLDTLLIVYYAGHGSPGAKPGHLQLFGISNPTDFEKSQKLNHIVWNWTESALQATQSDIFVIFDCCYANDLGGNRGQWPRKFEYLAATSKETTKRPGPHSFTSALLHSLADLAEKRKRFTSSELVNAIREAPNFPKGQVPTLSERGGANSRERIMLAPLPKASVAPPASESQDSESVEGKPVSDRVHQEIVTLKFFFESRPEKHEIETLGRELNAIVQDHNLRVCRIMWGGLRSFIREYANRFQTIRKRRQSSGLLSPSGDFRKQQHGRLYGSEGPMTPTGAPSPTQGGRVDRHLPRALSPLSMLDHPEELRDIFDAVLCFGWPRRSNVSKVLLLTVIGCGLFYLYSIR